MGTKTNPGRFDCYANAKPDEPLFVILGRDRIGGSLVRLWAAVRHTLGTSRDKVDEAKACAGAMDAWCDSQHPVGHLEVMEWLPFDILAAEWKRRGLPMPTAVVSVPVERDAHGWWMHPNWPWSATPEETSEGPTARALGLELKPVSMENQAGALHETYCENGEADCSTWDPEPPDADPAWFLTAIFDTEDGPVAHWCRPLSANLAQEALWAVHIAGPDDLYAAPDFDAAVEAADEFNAREAKREKHEYDPAMFASVTPWPYGPAQHGKSLSQWAQLVYPSPQAQLVFESPHCVGHSKFPVPGSSPSGSHSEV